MGSVEACSKSTPTSRSWGTWSSGSSIPSPSLSPRWRSWCSIGRQWAQGHLNGSGVSLRSLMKSRISKKSARSLPKSRRFSLSFSCLSMRRSLWTDAGHLSKTHYSFLARMRQGRTQIRSNFCSFRTALMVWGATLRSSWRKSMTSACSTTPQKSGTPRLYKRG